ncbi:MAG TPA: right-handed parallel beta-helix repeat-containing protein [Patescibacteria group bacterium]|nr:right-handed parallel beta-helix repeat-containing protein [Patescibacteria group bacterium]
MMHRHALVWSVLLLSSLSAQAATITVTSAAASGAGSLAEAITLANNAPGADTINFGIAGTGVKVLSVPASGYPAVTESLTIDGYTQTGALVNTVASGSTNAVLRIELNSIGMNAFTSVLRISAPTTVRGLAINRLPTGVTGIRVQAGGAGSSIRGCFFGTNADGTASGSGAGIDVNESTQIGSSTLADRNLFAGLSGGIFVSGSGSAIQGNLFGTFPNGTTGGDQGLGQGVAVRPDSTLLMIGGTGTGQGNVLRDISGIGIRLIDGATASTGISILGNSIDGVTGLPIDLGSDGVDLIDPFDADTGPNGRENTATLFYARKHGAQLLLQFKIDGDYTGGNKRVEFFASSLAHPSGSGAGTVFVASANLNPAALGESFFDLNLPGTPAFSALSLPQVISATVTHANGSTSEFSNAVPLVDGGQPRLVTNTNDSGAGSLRQAILNANANAGMDAISFNISGSGPHVIAPLSGLPSISGDLIIDGYTQNGSRPNFAAIGSDADLRIALDGSSAGFSNLLTISSGQTSVRGLNLRNAGNAGISVVGGSDHSVEGCFIGTSVDGTGDEGNAGNGVSGSANGVQIGGPGLHQRNVVSGNTAAGVNLSGNDWLIQNNVIGTAADGTTALGNSFGGISSTGSGGRIAGNRIRNNGVRGIGLPPTAVQVDIAGNAIFNNAGLGIDLNNDGLTANDANDADIGPNGLQNFPVLTGVTSLAAGDLRLAGLLIRPAGSTLTVRFDVFRSASCDAGGHGEGEVFLGSQSVTFLAAAPETFSFDLDDVNLPSASVVTVSATAGAGATSEFSACASSTVQPEDVFANDFE